MVIIICENFQLWPLFFLINRGEHRGKHPISRAWRITVLRRTRGKNDGMVLPSQREEKISTTVERWAEKERQMGYRKEQRLFEEQDMKERIWERKELSSMDYFVLCTKSKNIEVAQTEIVSAPLLFGTWASRASRSHRRLLCALSQKHYTQLLKESIQQNYFLW